MTQQIRQFSAQLASPASNMERFAPNTAMVPGGYYFEEKLDGIRAMIVFQPDRTIEVRNRHGEDKQRGKKNPWLMEALSAWAHANPALWDGTVLDGELVADTWNQTMHELSTGGDALRFVVFDLPFAIGQDQTAEPLHRRRMVLENLFKTRPAESERIVISPLLDYSPKLAIDVWERGGEGVIVKQTSAPYEAGGRKYWWKIKEVHTADAWICGFTSGSGKYSDTIGAVKLCQYRDGRPVTVTQISGMDDKQRRAFSAEDIGRVVEFEYHQRTAGSYRHPRWLKWRDDKRQEDCIWEATE